jgi:hypothetical protein
MGLLLLLDDGILYLQLLQRHRQASPDSRPATGKNPALIPFILLRMKLLKKGVASPFRSRMETGMSR